MLPHPSRPFARLALATVITGALLVAVLAGLVVWYRAALRAEIYQKIIQRDAEVLYPVAVQQLTDSGVSLQDPDDTPNARDILTSVLKKLQGMWAVTIFDAEGNPIQYLPPTLLLAEIPPADFPRLLAMERISRYHPQFPLDRYFAGIGGPPEQRQIPMLEVLLPLPGRDASRPIGFVQYYIDASSIAQDLAAIDRSIDQQTFVTLGLGAVLIAAIMLAAYVGLNRAQRVIVERTARLTHANFELTLAAKASALGQITSHLIHGLQGPVAGLRAVVTGRAADNVNATEDWQTAANYTARMQAMIQETVALLGDTGSQTAYELSGVDLANTIRQRNTPLAAQLGVDLVVEPGFAANIDSHRGSLLCLIATNLVENAVAVTPAGRKVRVSLHHRDGLVTLIVADQGPGIPEAIRAHLFQPGHSGRSGGSGLGLAISQLLARQIGGELALEATSPQGTTFCLKLPLPA
jgi:signal transduction histidine kinase